MGTEGEGGSGRSTWKKLGLSSVVAAAGAGVGLLLTTKPKRLRGAVSGLPGSARNLVEDLTHRGPAEDDADADDSSRPMPEEISDQFKARRRERRERRDRRRQHAST
jgi:hypothetical protein